jgi:hypothetical protein
MRRAHLELSIDELILPDLLPTQRERVVAAIEAELARLWAERGLPLGVRVASPLNLNAATVEAAAGARPEAIGVQVAQSIYTGLAGGSEGPGRPERSTG